MATLPEFWLRGPVEGVPPLLMPVVHALLQSRNDLREAAANLSPGELWDQPGGAASVGFHLRHIRKPGQAFHVCAWAARQG